MATGSRGAVAVLSRLLLTLVAVSAMSGRPALATVGLAEWEVSTPGGHLVSHVGPLKERFGTCLRKLDTGAGGVYADHLEWWMYYSDHVVGKGRSGYFLFNEPSGRLELFPSEASLFSQVTSRRLGAPSSKRLTPEDGWRDTWLPVYRAACVRFRADGPPSGVDPATHQRMKDVVASLGFN